MLPTNRQHVDYTSYHNPWLPDKIFTWNTQGIYTTHYRLHHQATIHYRTDQILNHHILNVLPFPQNQQFLTTFETTLHTQTPQVTSITFPKPNPCTAIIFLLPTDQQLIGLVKDLPPLDPLTIVNTPHAPTLHSPVYSITIDYPQTVIPPNPFSPFFVPEIWSITVQHLANQCGLRYSTPKSERLTINIYGPLHNIYNFFKIWNALHSRPENVFVNDCSPNHPQHE